MPVNSTLGWKYRCRVGDFFPRKRRHADMLVPCRRHDSVHVGDIGPCRLFRCADIVVLACRLPDMSVHNGGGDNAMIRYNNQIDMEEEEEGW